MKFTWNPFKKTLVTMKPRDPLENMGKLVRVNFPLTPLACGLMIRKNKIVSIANHWYGYGDVYAETKSFQYNPAKNITFAYGLVINETDDGGWGGPGPRTRIYFPLLLKSGARCLLDIPTKYVIYYLEDPENIKRRFLPEFARMFCSDNFKMMEFLAEHKKCVRVITIPQK